MSSFEITRTNFEKRAMIRCRVIIPLQDGYNLNMKLSKMKVSVVPAQTLPDFLDLKIWDEFQKKGHDTISEIFSR